MLQTLHCVRSTNGKDFQYCNCNENSAVPQADQPLHAVAFASRHLRISLRHVGTEPFEGAVIFRHIGSKLVQISSESVQGALLYLNCCIVFPSPTFERARRERKQLARLSRAGISYLAAHPFSPSPPRIFWSSNWRHPIAFGHAAETRIALQLRNPSQRKFARQHLRRAERRPAFDLPLPSQSKKWDAPFGYSRLMRSQNLGQLVGFSRTRHILSIAACWSPNNCGIRDKARSARKQG